MPSYRWVEISDFPSKGDFYTGDVLNWLAHPQSGLHGSLINPRIRPGEIFMTRTCDQDSHYFLDHVAMGDTIPNARFVTQVTKDDGTDSIVYNHAAWVEDLQFFSAVTRSRDGGMVDEITINYRRIDVKQDYTG